MSRKSAREDVYKLIFEYSFNKEKNDNTLSMLLLDSTLSNEDKDFVVSYYDGIVEHYDKLIDIIMEFCPQYTTFDRLVSTDRVSILFGAYELVYHPEISTGIIINEAVDLAKQFATEKSSGFVNGVLANIAKKERTNAN